MYITDKALCEVPTFHDTDIVFVAKVNSLEGLPHYTFQLTLGYPTKDREKHKDGLIIATRWKQSQFNSHNLFCDFSGNLKKS